MYTCDSLLVNGVHRMEVTQNAVMYANVVRREGFDKGAAGLANTVTKLEAFQKVAPQSNVFEYVTREICEIFYDANSPYRDEDLYATFAARLLLSPYCPAQMRETFRRDIRLCAMNRVGTPAADFVYVDRSGRRHHLYDIKTEYTLLVFLNPGCEACEQIVEPLAEPVVVNLIKSGRMTLLGMYIDEDIPDWLSKCEKLPELWKDGYDPDGIIRSDLIYHIRAIPSVYLLDRDKTVLLKDAHILFVSTELEKIYSNQ